MVKVRVPATTANMGAGFDALGAALKIYNYVCAEEISSGLEIIIKDEQTRTLVPTDERNLVYKTMKFLFSEARIEMPPVRIIQENNIPVTRGLGSSSASIVGGLVCANELAGRPFSKKELITLAARLEGHSDNSTSAFCGGFNVSVAQDNKIFYYTHKIDEELKFLVMIPDFQVKTREARNALPEKYSSGDVRYNISRSALFAASMMSGEYANLSVALGDKIHEPYRAKFICGYSSICEKAKELGALGTYISGSGPTLISLVLKEKSENLFKNMSEFVKKEHPEWCVLLTDADNSGAQII